MWCVRVRLWEWNIVVVGGWGVEKHNEKQYFLIEYQKLVRKNCSGNLISSSGCELWITNIPQWKSLGATSFEMEFLRKTKWRIVSSYTAAVVRSFLLISYSVKYSDWKVFSSILIPDASPYHWYTYRRKVWKLPQDNIHHFCDSIILSFWVLPLHNFQNDWTHNLRKDDLDI